MGDEYPPLTSFSDQKRSEAMEKYEIIKPHILEQMPLLTIFKKTDVPIRTPSVMGSEIYGTRIKRVNPKKPIRFRHCQNGCGRPGNN